MKTIKKVSVTTKDVETIPDHLEQNVIYISDKYKTAIHLCLCGCGHRAVTPFNMWNITDIGKGVTFTPSILNTNCPNRSHYIITNSVANFV